MGNWKNMRVSTIVRRPLVAVIGAAVAAGTLGPAVAAHADSPKRSQLQAVVPARSSTAAEDGKTIFRAVYLGIGPLAAKLAKLDEFSAMRSIPHDAKSENSRAHAAAILVPGINSVDPAFFADLSNAVRKGTPYDVEQVLARGNALVEKVAKVDSRSTLGTVKPTCGAVAVIAVVVAHVAAAVTAGAIAVEAAAVAGQVVVYAQVWLWGATPGATQLSKEQALSSMITSIRTA
jgi:SdpC family antimicrobial peptide